MSTEPVVPTPEEPVDTPAEAPHLPGQQDPPQNC